MIDNMIIQSHKGRYNVKFSDDISSVASKIITDDCHIIIDANVAKIYANIFSEIVLRPNTIVIEAVETNKSIEQILPIIYTLVENNVRRDHKLVAIGGGIIQDITCFIASTLLRGLPWSFIPTTLLAQADSCIGSKSSINLGETKNILGTFNPPNEIVIIPDFLDSLEMKDIQSGIGEIIKVHIIDGSTSFDRLANDFDKIYESRHLLLNYIISALKIKKKYIEVDEFDRGIRNTFNYGHSFGHAIESATHYAIPHGIAVTIGMDMANFIAAERGILPGEHFRRMHPVLEKNYRGFAQFLISPDAMMSALMKDKKNTSNMLGLVFPVGEDANIEILRVCPDSEFRNQCKKYLEQLGQ